MSDHLGGAYKRLFPQKHIPIILILVLKVGKTFRKQSETDREDRLTTRLYRQLIREPVFRDGPLQINSQTDIVNSEVDSEKNTVEGRLDLQVSCGHGFEVYFAIEAKRLRVSLPSGLFSGSREYVKNGMMRFVTGQYAPFMEAGAMLGYIYDGNIKNAHSDIDRQILKHERELKLKEPKKLTPSILLSHQCIDETKHDLENRSFTVYHLFLAV
jgi:hypothetical protein